MEEITKTHRDELTGRGYSLVWRENMIRSELDSSTKCYHRTINRHGATPKIARRRDKTSGEVYMIFLDSKGRRCRETRLATDFLIISSTFLPNLIVLSKEVLSG